MRKTTAKKIQHTFLIGMFIFIISVGLIVYIILGPFKSLFWNLPYLGGFLGSRTYLVLLLNNYELRPAGGFISAYATVKASFGNISVIFHNSYDVPDPNPRIPGPKPFQTLIGKADPFYAGMTFRDANFSPDFAKSSEQVISLYNQAYPDEAIDMVVAADFHVIESLLEVYKYLDVENIRFTKQNFFALTQIISKHIDTHNQEQLKNRKNIISPLGNTLISKIKKEPFNYKKVFGVLAKELQQKHLQLYTPKSLQKKFTEKGWSGEILASPESQLHSDFLHLNTANIGGRKADRYVQKKFDYTLTFRANNPPLAKLTADFSHRGDYNIQSDVYQAYFRAYVPLGSKLIQGSESGLEKTEVGSDLNLSYFADLFKIKPNETIRLQYNYLLPEFITAENYRLYIPKQAGTSEDLLTVTIRTPNDTTLNNSSLLEEKSCGINENLNVNMGYQNKCLTVKENIATYTGILQTNLSFAATLQADTQPPIVLWQEFEGLKTINIRFHEQIDEQTIQNLSHFNIKDLNYSNTQTDTITVSSARFQDRDLWLTVSGVSSAPLERYQLTIKNIADISGNIITPNPATYTLVQR